MNYKKRIIHLQKLLSQKKLDAFLVTNPSNIFYLTGFKGVSPTEKETIALIDKSGLILFSPKLYQSETKELGINNHFKVEIIRERNLLLSKPVIKYFKGKTIGFESESISFSEYSYIKNLSKIILKPTKNIIENLRLVKDKYEIEYVKTAVKITDNIFTQIKEEIKPGLTEKQIARRLVELMERLGADGPSFEPIVASDVNSSLPHYVTSNNKIKKGILLIDAGARYKGYNADLTRTFYLGDPDSRFIKSYNLVLFAQKSAIEKTQEGVKEEEVWTLAVKLLGKVAKYFTHGLGHGIGIDVHESPYLRKGCYQPLKENMLVTIEPGLYFPNWGGIRIEDYIQITKKTNIILSKSPKNIEDIVIK